MPGIVGIFSSQKSPEECRQLVDVMTASMQHEPFYTTGSCSAPELGLFTAWVAHPDSFAAINSGSFNANGIALAFAGECIDTAPDTNWIRNRYEKDGKDFIASLNGLFSGLLIDSRKQQAYLFNDRYGIERIYYHETPEALYFASEAKALLKILPHLRSFDDEGVAQFLAYGCTTQPRTLFKGISLVTGGSCWTLALGQPARKSAYFSPKEWEQLPTLTETQFDDQFYELFPRIFPKYTYGNQQLGVSLTGGFDSRMVMACLPPGAKPECYTYSGRTENLLDSRIAAKLAKTLNLNHHLLRIKDDFLKDFLKWSDQTVYVTDGACSILGTHEIYYSKAVRKLAPIRLTGNFGSEILRSVSTFKPQHLAPSLFTPAVAEAVKRQQDHRPEVPHPVTFAAFHEVPHNLFGTLCAGRTQLTFRTPYLDNELVALAYQAPTSSRTSPLPALRFIGRYNPKLAAIPTDRGQIGTKRGPIWLARRIFGEVTFKLDYMHKEGMPKQLSAFDPLLNVFSPFGLLGLHKFLPYRRWFREELASDLRKIFNDPRTRELPFFNGTALDAILENHLKGKTNHVREIGAVLTLEAVDRLLLRKN